MSCEKASTKVSSMFSTISDAETGILDGNNDKNLQKSFSKFRRERFEKMKHAKYLQQCKSDERRSPEFKASLRNKFIEQCKKYFGVPYHKKYWAEGESHFNAPLYLDCCGLIRQVIYDLRDDFGFSLGRWNQAYQFDICQKSLTFEEMKPGDLIFYSATYYNEKLKPFPHKMVHVEVFTGGDTGRQTIGARFQKGFVQFHEDYAFVSKNYYDIQFHFRSLDTWLDGICYQFVFTINVAFCENNQNQRSGCSQHPWRDDRDLWVPDKYSVFADADMESDEETDEERKLKHQTVIQAPKEVFVGKGNNDALIRKYFSTKPEYIVLDASRAFSPKFYFKWVQTVSEIDFFSFKERQQIVNHIPNINILTSKVGLVNLLREYDESVKEKKVVDTKCDQDICSPILPPTRVILSSEFFPKSYQLDIVSDEISFVNEVSDPKSVWILKPHNNNMGRGIIMIDDILQFKREFVEAKKHNLGDYATKYLLNKNEKEDADIIDKKGDISAATSDKDAVVVAGVIIGGTDVIETAKKELKYEGISHHSIIQRYIANPLLLEGKKFDIRCYCLIASAQPAFLLFHKGYARVCLQDYSLVDVGTKEQRHCHLTNAAIQKTHKDYKAKKEESIWSIDRLHSYISTQYGYGLEEQSTMWDRIREIIKHVVLLSLEKNKLEKKQGQYELLGVDIMLDTSLNPYLLELNTNPALFTDTTTQLKTIPDMMHKVLDVVLRVNDPEDNKTVEDRIKEILLEREQSKSGGDYSDFLAPFEFLFSSLI